LQYLFYDSLSILPIGKIQYQTDAVVNTAKCIHLDYARTKINPFAPGLIPMKRKLVNNQTDPI